MDRRGQLSYFIQKKRTPVGLFDQPLPRPVRAGERAPEMAEQGAFDKRFGKRRAIDDDEAGRGPAAVFMDGRGEQLLAGPGLPRNQDVGVA